MTSVSREDKVRAVRACPDYLYTTRPGDGTTHYVFINAVFFRLDSAYDHALTIAAADRHREPPDAQRQQ